MGYNTQVTTEVRGLLGLQMSTLLVFVWGFCVSLFMLMSNLFSKNVHFLFYTCPLCLCGAVEY